MFSQDTNPQGLYVMYADNHSLDSHSVVMSALEIWHQFMISAISVIARMNTPMRTNICLKFSYQQESTVLSYGKSQSLQEDRD